MSQALCHLLLSTVLTFQQPLPTCCIGHGRSHSMSAKYVLPAAAMTDWGGFSTTKRLRPDKPLLTNSTGGRGPFLSMLGQPKSSTEDQCTNSPTGGGEYAPNTAPALH
jgi:hypothetical protein